MKAFKLDESRPTRSSSSSSTSSRGSRSTKIRDERAEKTKRLEEIEALLEEPEGALEAHQGDSSESPRSTATSAARIRRRGEELAFDADAFIVHEEATVVLTRDGWLKRVRELKDPCRRAPRGRRARRRAPGLDARSLALFSSHGSVYVMRVTDIAATTGYGEPVQSLLKFGDGERVVAARERDEPRGEAAPSRRSLLATGDGRTRAAWCSSRRRGATASAPTPDLSETTRPAASWRASARATRSSASCRRRRRRRRRDARGQVLRFKADEVAELAGPGRGVIDEDRRTTTASSARRRPARATFVAVTPEGGERYDRVARRAGRAARAARGTRS